MRGLVCLYLAFFLGLFGCAAPVYAADGDLADATYIDQEEWASDGLEGIETYLDVPDDVPVEVSDPADPDLMQDVYELLDARLPLGSSGDHLDPYIKPPAIHELVGGGGAAAFSLRTQTNYPYTGGSFMAVDTNSGSGLFVLPEPFKVNTFGFVKDTDRVVNLTNSTVNGYWVSGGETYNLRFSRYGEAEYQSNSSSYTWYPLSVSSVTDTNVQFLDETGERGIQRPYLSLETKIFLAFLFLELFIHLISVLRSGSR